MKPRRVCLGSSLRWILQPAWLLVVISGAAAAVWLREWMPYVLGGACVAALGLWVLVSTLWPSAPDRKCPKCGVQGLVKIRRGAPGVRCERCGFQDETMHVAYLDDW